MSRFNYRRLTSQKRAELLNQLCQVVLAIKKPADMRQFLQRLLTPSEITMLARRLEVARALAQGKSPETIREEIGVGYSTIHSIEQWLEYITDDKKTRQGSRKQSGSLRRREPDIPGSFDDTRHRYGNKFLLLNLLLDL